MSLSQQTVNVIRYSALGAGILYGFSHQRKLNAQAHLRAAESEYKHKESLIAQAKAEFAKRKATTEKKTPGDVISDPNDPRFDLEAFLTKLAESAA
ncbi:F1F0 ATP synthase subunit e, mitochondrial [Rhizina undulata]